MSGMTRNHAAEKPPATTKGTPELGPVLRSVLLVCWPTRGFQWTAWGQRPPDRQVNPETRQFTVTNLVTRPPNWWSKALHSLPISAGRPRTGDRQVKCGRWSPKRTSTRADRLPVRKGRSLGRCPRSTNVRPNWSAVPWDGALSQRLLDKVDEVESCFKVELQAVVTSMLRTTVATRRHNVTPSNDITKIDGRE